MWVQLWFHVSQAYHFLWLDAENKEYDTDLSNVEQ